MYIADIALLNGVNSEKGEKTKTDIMSSSLELQYKMYEIFLEAAERGRTITCDATRDTSGMNIDKMAQKGLIKVVEDEEDRWSAGSDIEMRRMEFTVDSKKIEKEMKELKVLLDKAHERNIIYERGEDR